MPASVRVLADELLKKMRFSHSVSIVRSALVEVPAVVGWFRPLILLPACILTRLSETELRAVIAHELAHIRRHDYLINLMQRAAETLLFFHPFVWWLSNQIRDERENCCDDLALSAIEDKAAYVRALLEVDELGELSTSAAMGANGGSLLARVRRITGSYPAVPRSNAWLSGLALALVFPVLAISFPNASQKTNDADAVPAVVQSTDAPGDNLRQLLRTGVGLNITSKKDKGFMEFRVLDPDTGAGVSGVRLKIDWESGSALPDQMRITDSDGVVPIVTAGMKSRDLKIWILDERFVPRVVAFRAGDGKSRPPFFAYTAEKCISIGGKIVDEQGEPLAGAVVSITPPVRSNLIMTPQADGNLFSPDYIMASVSSEWKELDLIRRTDAEGQWSFTNAPAYISKFVFSVTHAGHQNASFGCSRNQNNSVQTIVSETDLKSRSASMALKEAFLVSGMVVDSSNAPIKGAKVVTGDAAVLTGSDGRFEFDRSETGTGLFGVTRAGYLGQSRTLKSKAESTGVTFKLEEGRVLRIRVVDESEQPLERVRVSLSSLSTSPGIARWSAYTDIDGRVSWDSAPLSAKYYISKIRYGRLSSQTYVAGKTEHLVHLPQDPIVTGTAVDADTGEPIAGFIAILKSNC